MPMLSVSKAGARPLVRRRSKRARIRRKYALARSASTAGGTHINGRKITGIVELRAGDRINLWPHTLRFTDQVSADTGMVSVGQSGLFRLAAS